MINRLASLIATPTPSAGVMQVMNRISNASPQNILPTVVLEAGVTSGRSAYAWKRNGFLEFQERLLEEAAVALIWLSGVQGLGHLFDWTANRVLSNPMDTAIGWTLKNGAVDLSPLEQYTARTAAAKDLLKLKGARLAFSVLTSIGLVAFAVPWLNQKKTEWLIKTFYVPHSPEPPRSLAPSFQVPKGFQAFSPQNSPPGKPTALTFGGMGERVLNQVGHWVQDTDLGSLFAIDTGILGGRALSAARRSRFESIEVVLRDLASYYFYFLAVPHAMGAANTLVKRMWGGNIQLEPLIGQRLNRHLMKETAQWLASTGNNALSKATLETLLLGTKPTSAAQAERLRNALKHMADRLCTAPKAPFLTLLEKELAVFFPKTALSQALLTTLQAQLGETGPTLQTGQLQRLLATVERGADPVFSGLSTLERGDLVRALKHAFRNSSGVSRTTLETLPALQEFLQTLSTEGQQQLNQRLAVAVSQDTHSLINSMIRRMVVVAQDATSLPHALKAEGELLSQWVEKANSRGISFSQLLQQESESMLEGLSLAQKHLPESVRLKLAPYFGQPLEEGAEAFLATLREVSPALAQSGQKRWRGVLQQLESLSPLPNMTLRLTAFWESLQRELPVSAAQDLVREYTTALSSLLAQPQQGRLFSLHVDTAAQPLVEKLEAILLGGLQRDSVLVREGMRQVGVLVEDGRYYAHPGKFRTIQRQIQTYLETFLNRLTANGPLGEIQLQEALAHYFSLSRNCRYVANVLGIGFGIWGLSYLIPKVQYTLTAKLTGRNEHPGIASVLKREKLKQGEAPQSHQGQNPKPFEPQHDGEALDRHHFITFRQTPPPTSTL